MTDDRHSQDPADTIDPDDELITCWCGVTGIAGQMFSREPFKGGGCCGTRTLNCYCGGDQCVCHHHGEVECPGCEDCGYGDELEDFDWEQDAEEEVETDAAEEAVPLAQPAWRRLDESAAGQEGRHQPPRRAAADSADFGAGLFEESDA